MRIWSKTSAGTCGLKRFMISWFISFLRMELFVSDGGGRTTDDRCTAPRCFSVLCHPAAGLWLLGRSRRSLGAASLLGIVQVDVEAERAHFLDQHVEAFGNARLERVIAAHDCLVDLGTAGDVVRLHGEHFLQRV